MAQWIEPIYDRTQADVDYAKSQLSLGNNGTENKGCFNITDILRIENNTRYLADKTNELFYFNNISTVHSWSMSSIPYFYHINRIINNVGILWEKYSVPTGSVSLPPSLLRYNHLNDLEKNLYLLKKHIDDMVGYFRECNTFECGEE